MTDEMHEQNKINKDIAADIAEAGMAEEQGECIDDAKELMAALARCQRELAEAKNAYVRAHADFDNFRKRLRAERDQEFGRGTDRVLADLLNLIDDFERALEASKKSQAPASMMRGIELLYRQFVGLLERYGLKPMEAMGQPFDPKYHDAVARMASKDAPEHTIIGVIQQGYLKNGEVFRPAKVAVAVAPDEPME